MPKENRCLPTPKRSPLLFSETTGTPGVLLFLAVMTLMIVLRRFFFKEDEEEEREDEDEARRGRVALSLLGLATALALFAWYLWGGD